LSPTVVILAAGLGSRLAGTWQRGPKWLAAHGEGAIADRQLEAVGGLAGATVLTVVGHGASEVESFLARRGGQPQVQLVYNPRFSEWNNWYSLLLGLETASQLTPDAPVLVLNGDLVIPSEWVRSFVNAFLATESPALLAVDSHTPPSEEAMKVVKSGNRIEAIGKTGLSGVPFGEYIGMTMLSVSAVEAVRATLSEFESKDLVSDWYEKGFGLLMADGLPFGIWDTPHSNWVEVDDPADFARARTLMGANR
jgi:choline kinase